MSIVAPSLGRPGPGSPRPCCESTPTRRAAHDQRADKRACIHFCHCGECKADLIHSLYLALLMNLAPGPACPMSRAGSQTPEWRFPCLPSCPRCPQLGHQLVAVLLVVYVSLHPPPWCCKPGRPDSTFLNNRGEAVTCRCAVHAGSFIAERMTQLGVF